MYINIYIFEIFLLKLNFGRFFILIIKDENSLFRIRVTTYLNQRGARVSPL
jgi:hypothetical protein